MSRLQRREPAAVEAGGEIVLIDQRFEILERSIGLGPRQRRRQMIDDDGRGAPLGLRAFAGIVDDERVELGQGAEHRFRIACRGQRCRLARQPFEIAVLAVVDHRMGAEALAQPEIEGEIAMRRHQRRIVIGGLGIDIVAARRLDRDGDIAVEQDRAGRKAPPAKKGSLLRLAPALGDLPPDTSGRAAKGSIIVAESERDDACMRGSRIGAASLAGARSAHCRHCGISPIS